MTEKPVYNLKWLKENALFSCQGADCAAEVSYHAHDLAVHPDNGEPICEYCWEGETDEEDASFLDLEPFAPFAMLRTKAESD